MSSASRALAVGSVADTVLSHSSSHSRSSLRSVNRDLNSSFKRRLFEHAVACLVESNKTPSVVIRPLSDTTPASCVRLAVTPRPDASHLTYDEVSFLRGVRVLDVRDANAVTLKALATHRPCFPNLRFVRVFPSSDRYKPPARRPAKKQTAENEPEVRWQQVPYKRVPILGTKVIYFTRPNLGALCLFKAIEAREVVINIDLAVMDPDAAEQKMVDYMPRCPLAIGLNPRLAVIFSPRDLKSKALDFDFVCRILGRLAWHLRTHAHGDTVPGLDFPIKREALPRFTIVGLENVVAATNDTTEFHDLQRLLVNELSARFSCVGCPLPATCRGTGVIPESQAAEHVLDFETFSDYMDSISELDRSLESVAGARVQ